MPPDKEYQKTGLVDYMSEMIHPIILLVIALVILLATYQAAVHYGWLEIILDQNLLKATAQSAGKSGIFMIIGLMIVAIVLNPIPSAPIAMVAGALYGHTWGTIYIVIGALIGAVVAFLIARVAGRTLICRLLGKHSVPSWIGSQNSMMIMVLLSRLIPFISFDLVSYGAGLTSLTMWRFVLATLIGLIPASFLLAHFGSELTANELDESMLYILAIGMLVLLPVGFGLMKKIRSNGV
ncbi:MAG: TVP38/TMEM64 family protein [Candidatus Pacearchaeota archaeon]|nr:TVP38/TMEM64 family protein [Candidatus Pacearchaeota archaeon]